MGLGVGAIADSKKPDQKSFPGWQVKEVEPKSDATLKLGTDSSVTGKYMGYYAISDEVYAATYADAKERLGILPVLGDTIRIVGLSGGNKNGTMCGFDRLSILYQYELATKSNKLTIQSKWELSAVDKVIDPKGHEISGTELLRLGSAGEIPFRSRILMKVYKDTLSVPLEKVIQIDVKVKKHARRNLLIAGAVVDALVILTAILGGVEGPGIN